MAAGCCESHHGDVRKPGHLTLGTCNRPRRAIRRPEPNTKLVRLRHAGRQECPCNLTRTAGDAWRSHLSSKAWFSIEASGYLHDVIVRCLLVIYSRRELAVRHGARGHGQAHIKIRRQCESAPDHGVLPTQHSASWKSRTAVRNYAFTMLLSSFRSCRWLFSFNSIA